MQPDEVNALPEPVRRYIHDLETRCDPAGELAELALTRDQNLHLQAEIERMKKEWSRDREVLAIVADLFLTYLRFWYPNSIAKHRAEVDTDIARGCRAKMPERQK